MENEDNPLRSGTRLERTSEPCIVVIFGATGDLTRRKLLPDLFHLSNAGFIPSCKIIAVALDDINLDDFRRIARAALDEFTTRKVSQSE